MKFLGKIRKMFNVNLMIALLGIVGLIVLVNQVVKKKATSEEALSNSLSPAEFSELEPSSEEKNGNFSNIEETQNNMLVNSNNPEELLPADQNNEWSKLNPVGTGDLNNVNLLKAGYHTGIDTVGSSMRNANLQVRSEPPNPTTKVSPWLETTIEPDTMRLPLEIGTH